FDGNAAFTTGAVGALGIARGRLALYADLGDSYVSAPDGATATTLGRGAGQAMASDGGLRRIGGRVRYSFARWLSMSGDDDIGEGAVYAMLGAGHQRVDWGGGGRLDRNDVVLGIGGLLGEQLSHRHHVDRHLAFYLDVLMTYTRHREPIGPPTCAGPCDVPTSPSSIDASVTVDMGVLFGG
ncbi:MAG TPA: hypothetical protein VLX92_11710, partial [Kofleriaceae bacterium]|nr:hypothetical protein [Kofleriaceae bacterium]